MPTGITADIHDGKDVSLEDFILTCARQFGLFYEQRDDAFGPVRLKLRDTKITRYDDDIQRAVAEIAALNNTSDDELMAKQLADIEAETARYASYDKERGEIATRYHAMLDRVKAWPAPEAWHQLKTFAVEQLTSSIEHDGPFNHTPREVLPVADYRTRLLVSAQRSLAMRTENKADAEEGAVEHNKMVLALAESLNLPVDSPGVKAPA